MNIGGFMEDAMARNMVQFQKGLSEPEFERQYGTEEQCRAALSRRDGRTGSSAPSAGSSGTAW